MAKKQIISVGCLIASVLLACATVFFPFTSLVTVYASAVFFAFAVITSPSLFVVWIGSALTFIAVLLFSGSVSGALMFLLMFFPVGSALGIGFRSKKGFNETMALVSLFAAGLGLLALILFVGEFSDWSFDAKDALSPVFNKMKEFMLESFSAADPAVNSLFESKGASLAQFVNTSCLLLVSYIPLIYMGFMLCLAVLAFWMIKAIMIRTDTPVNFMGRFDGCRISYLGALLYFISTIVMLFSSNSVLGIAIANFSNIMTYVFAYAGISLIAYFLDFKNFSPFFKWAILIFAFAVCLIPTGLLNIISLLGIVDAYWNIREKLNNSGI